MADEIKFTEEELKSLQELQTNYRNLQMQMGALKLQQIAHDKQADQLSATEEELMNQLAEMQATEQTQAKELNDKYGQGTLDPATGVFTPTPNEAAEEVKEES
mgnify:CR=1 FL=1